MSQVLAVLTLLVMNFGGWAVITVEDLPDQVAVGQPHHARFHGTPARPYAALQPEAPDHGRGRPGPGERRRAAGSVGRTIYRASLTLPQAGAWTITVYSGFGNSNVTLMPVPAVSPGRAAPAIASAERGRRLFVAKGCITCHVHPDVPASGVVNVGPDLTGRRFTGDYLQRFLADPNIATTRGAGGFEMPNLNLAPREIAALAAFINGAPAQSGE